MTISVLPLICDASSDKQGYVAVRCNRGIRCLFGDQTLFCRAADFKAVGGFQDDLPIMEDVDLCIRMHEAGTTISAHQSHHGHNRRGRISVVMNPVNETSGRRLSDWGALHATYVHFYIALRWYFGAPQNRCTKYTTICTQTITDDCTRCTGHVMHIGEITRSDTCNWLLHYTALPVFVSVS